MQVVLRQVQRAARCIGTCCAQPVQILLLNFLFLHRETNSLGPDYLTVWRTAKWEKCSIQTKDRVKAGEDLTPSVDSGGALEVVT